MSQEIDTFLDTEFTAWLILHIGEERLFEARYKSLKYGTKEEIEIDGKLLGGDLMITVTFDGRKSP